MDIIKSRTRGVEFFFLCYIKDDITIIVQFVISVILNVLSRWLCLLMVNLAMSLYLPSLQIPSFFTQGVDSTEHIANTIDIKVR